MLSKEKQEQLIGFLQAERDANDTGAVRKQRMQLHDVRTTMDRVSREVRHQLFSYDSYSSTASALQCRLPE